jgi:hypothetical protein
MPVGVKRRSGARSCGGSGAESDVHGSLHLETRTEIERKQSNRNENVKKEELRVLGALGRNNMVGEVTGEFHM